MSITKEQKRIIAIKNLNIRKGMTPWNKGKKGVQVYKKGRIVSQETRKKLSLSRIGLKPPMLGKKHTEETRKKLSASHMNIHRGEKSGMWKGGITPINMKIRQSTEMKLWRNAVFERDKHTCIWCGQVGGKLNADHIKSFKDYPELRFAIDNGRTLCVPCHKTTENYAGRGRKKII